VNSRFLRRLAGSSRRREASGPVTGFGQFAVSKGRFASPKRSGNPGRLGASESLGDKECPANHPSKQSR
jgi:hypothetical protein